MTAETVRALVEAALREANHAGVSFTSADLQAATDALLAAIHAAGWREPTPEPMTRVALSMGRAIHEVVEEIAQLTGKRHDDASVIVSAGYMRALITKLTAGAAHFQPIAAGEAR